MNTRFKHAVQNLDFYGIKVDLNFQGKLTHKTCFGSVISVFMVILLSLVCYVYGKEIIEKKKPIVISNERFVRNPQRMSFDKVQQTMIMGFRNFQGQPFYDPSIFQVTANLYVMDNRYNSTLQKNLTYFVAKPLKVRPCTIKDIQGEEQKEFFGSLELNKFTCFEDNQDVFIEGDISGDYFTRIEVYFKQCQNSTQPNSTVCAPQEKLDESLKIVNFVTYIIDKLVDSTNLEKPFEYQAINLYSVCSNKLSKELTAFFSNYYIQTDQGIVNEDIEEVRDFIFNGMTESASFEDPQIITKLVVRPLKNRETILKRRYMKISDLVAQLGGLLKLIAVIGAVITIPFAKFNLNEEIINHMFDIEFDDIDEVGQKNNKEFVNSEINEKNQQSQIKIPSNLYVDNNQYQQHQPVNLNNQQLEQSNNYGEFEISNKMPNQKQIRLLSSKFNQNQASINNKVNKDKINYHKKKSDISQNQHVQSIQKQLKSSNKQIDNQTSNNFQTLNSPKLTGEEQNFDNFGLLKQSQGYSNPNIMSRKQSVYKWAQEKIQPIRKLIDYNIIEQFQHIFVTFSQKIKRQKQFIDLSIQRVNQHLDIQFILNKFQEVDKLKQILLTEDQIKLFEFIPRPKIQRHPKTNEIKINSKYFQQEKSYDEKCSDVYISLQNIFKKEKKSVRDLKLIELLDPNLMTFVEQSDYDQSQNILKQDKSLNLNTMDDMRKINDEVKETYNGNDLNPSQTSQPLILNNQSSQSNILNTHDLTQHTQINNTKSNNDDDEDISENKFKFFLKYNKNSLNT